MSRGGRGRNINSCKGFAKLLGRNAELVCAIEAALVPILVEFGKLGKDVAVGIFAAWLYDKLKGEGEGRKFIRVNRVMVEVTPEAITKVLKGSIEVEERK